MNALFKRLFGKNTARPEVDFELTPEFMALSTQRLSEPVNFDNHQERPSFMRTTSPTPQATKHRRENGCDVEDLLVAAVVIDILI